MATLAGPLSYPDPTMMRPLALVLLSVLAAPALQAQESSIMAFPGTFSPRGINMDGSVVFGNGTIPGAPAAPAYRWNDGAYRTLPVGVVYAAVTGTHYLGYGTLNGTPGYFRVTVNPTGNQAQRLVGLVSDPGTATGLPSITPDGTRVYGATPNPGGGVGTQDATQAAVWTAGGPPTQRLPPPSDGQCVVWPSTGVFASTNTDAFGEAYLYSCNPGMPGIFRGLTVRWPGATVAPNPSAIRASGDGTLIAVYYAEGAITYLRGSSSITRPPANRGCQFNGFSFGGGSAIGGACYWRADLGWVRLLDLLAERGVNVAGWTNATVSVVSGDNRVVAGTAQYQGVTVGFRAVIGGPVAGIVVNAVDDDADESAGSGPCDTGDDVEVGGILVPECTLRAAIETANARSGGRITFDIPGGGVPRVDVPAETEDDRLPAFTASITLDATTQPGGWVELVGPGQRLRAGASDPRIAGIEMTPAGGGSEVHGLVIHGFRDAGIILRQGADECLIEGNRIGTDVTGTQARGNGDQVGRQFGDDGPFPYTLVTGGVEVYSSGNVIRGNVLAGNVWANEIVGTNDQNVEGGTDLLFGPTAFGNRVEGNRIGVGIDGAVLSLPPLSTFLYEYIGIAAVGGGQLTVGGPATGVPGACTGTCNLVAGHQVEMWLSTWRDPGEGGQTFPGASGVTVEGNVVGVDASGAIPPARTTAFDRGGIYAGGGLTPEPNRVAYNLVAVAGRESTNGIAVSGAGEIVGNTVRGNASIPVGGFSVNHVGIKASGPVTVRSNLVVGNTRWGILADSPETVVERNEVADNPAGGIIASGGTVTENHVHGNGIGVAVYAGGHSRITANRIYDNRIGIDLTPHSPLDGEGDGVTPNDYGDGDDGGNGLQNFPNVLQASVADGRLTVSGFISAPLLAAATYTVDAYLSAGCRSEATHGGMVFGQGEHFFYGYQTTSSLGEADIDFDEGNVPAGYDHISFTATRDDVGETSEFSRCVPIVGSAQVAQADVSPGQSGPVLDGQGTAVTIAASGSRGGEVAAHDGGTLYLTRYEAAPDTSVFAEGTATGPGGTVVTPEAVAARYWLLADRGLTTEGGATSNPATFSVCLSPTGVVLPGALSTVVVVRRSETTAGEWTPYPTTLMPHGAEQYLCANGVTSLGEFGVGGSEASFPVGTEDDGPLAPERPLAFAAYPNPVRGAATVSVSVPEPQRVSVAVYDLLGRRVAVLHEGPLVAGTHTLQWEAGALPSGVYVVRAVGEGSVVTQRVTVVR